MYQAALFDMDGLLLDTERVYLSTFRQSAKDIGFPHPDRLDDIFRSMVGLRAKDSDGILVSHVGRYVDIEEFKQRWMHHTVAALSENIPVQATVRETLASLAANEMPCAVATSTRTIHAIEHLHRAGIGDYFEVVIGGEQVSRGKPDPEIYHRAAASLGVEITKCAAFEDSNTGIQAAVASGATAVQVPDMVLPTDDVRRLKHVIADDLISGARAIGLLK